MADPRHALGIAAEDAVAGWLTAAGWRVVGRRLRTARGGEIDVLAIDPGQALVAVEVRARRTSRTGAAAVTVDARRVERLRHALASAAAEHRVRSSGLRVDLVTVEPDQAPGRWRLTRLVGIG
jgi:putative endonuclease